MDIFILPSTRLTFWLNVSSSNSVFHSISREVPQSNFSSQCPPSGCIWSWFSARGRQGCSTRCQECGFILIKDHWSQSWLMTTGHQQSVGTISCFNVLRFKVFWRGPSAKTCFMSFRISAHCWSPLSLQNGQLRNKHEDVLRSSGINPLECATLLVQCCHLIEQNLALRECD